LPDVYLYLIALHYGRMVRSPFLKVIHAETVRDFDRRGLCDFDHRLFGVFQHCRSENVVSDDVDRCRYTRIFGYYPVPPHIVIEAFTA
jgi:hypothetical protein